MRGRISRIKYFLILAALSLLVTPAWAQKVPSIEHLEVELLPEYDRPAILVIYRVRIGEGSSMPLTVSLPIPASVGEPHALAKWYPDGSRDDRVEWTRHVEGAWAWIEIQTDTPGIWLEYYDDLTFVGEERDYVFQWPGGIDIDEAVLSVQHPLGAGEMHLTPSGERFVGEDGMTYDNVELGAEDASESFALEFSYRKPSMFEAMDFPSIEGQSPIEYLEVALWPEFDRSAVLVFYRIRLEEDIQLPTTISLPIPEAVGDPFVVAKQLPDGSLDDRVEWNRRVDGEWAIIDVQTDTNGVWLEYYDELVFDGQERGFTFLWPAGFKPGSFAYKVQQPAAATEMLVTPPGILIAGDDGLLVYQDEIRGLTDESPVSISFAYLNTTSQLTTNLISPSPALVRPDTTRGETPDIRTWLPWMIGGFGAALLALGLILYFRLGRVRKRSPTRRRRRPSKESVEAGREIDASPVFCHSCGMQASVSDHFCRRCGTQLRR